MTAAREYGELLLTHTAPSLITNWYAALFILNLILAPSPDFFASCHEI